MRVLLVATTTGYQIRSFGEAAARAGVELTLASDRCDHLDDPWRDGAVPVRFHETEASVETVVSALHHDPPVGVLAVGDRPAVLAAAIAAAFRLPGHPPAAAVASRNKVLSRRAFDEAGLPTPAFRVESISSDGAALAGQLAYPVVVKPLALSGSRGVIRADAPGPFHAAFDRVVRILRSVDVREERDPAHDHVLVESFVPGQEVAIEGLLTRGRFQLLAIMDKPDPLNGPYFEETIYVAPSRTSASLQAAIERAVAAAAQALGLFHGPIHAECRVNDDGVYVLEVAARPIGGLCSKFLRFTSPGRGTVSLEDLLLHHAIGHDVTAWVREPEAAGVMMIPIPRWGIYRGVDGLERARAVAGIDDIQITAKPDSTIVPLPEGRSYLGFIFAHARAPELAEERLREAHRCLRFRIGRAVGLEKA
jgi:formate-dependent phosphoribosylglycinamide formyltransferase (GAR transformylase)